MATIISRRIITRAGGRSGYYCVLWAWEWKAGFSKTARIIG